LAFATNCDLAGKTVNEVIDGLITKCLAAPKTKTKDLAKQVFIEALIVRE
jgi:cytoskeleton-associated protein 5